MNEGWSKDRMVRDLVDRFLAEYRSRWSQEKVAKKVDGVSQSDLSRWESGDYEPKQMTYDKINALKRALGEDDGPTGPGDRPALTLED